MIKNLTKVNILNTPALLLGLSLYKKQQFKQAQNIFDKLLKNEPNNAYLSFRYGMCLYKERKWGEAYIYIKKAVELDPSQKSWVVQFKESDRNSTNKTKAKVAESKKKILETPNNPETIWSHAKNLLNDKQYWMAKVQTEKYLALKPNTEKALYQLATIYEALSDNEQAIEVLIQLNNVTPFNINYLYRLGYNYAKDGNEEGSQQYYEIVLALSPDDADVSKYGVGVFHANRGLWQDAAETYEDFMSKNGASPELLYRLGIAYERLYKWEKSAVTFEQAINSSPVIIPQWCYKCGQAYERAENYTKAIEHYRESVNRSNSYNDYWYYRLALTLEKTGNLKESTHYYKLSRRRTHAYAIAPKDIVKSKNQEYLSYYAEYYEKIEINSTQVVIESFFGSSISGNPYAILCHMLDHGYDYTYFVVTQDETVIPEKLKFNNKITFVKRGTDLYLRSLCSAKYLVNNVSFPYYYIRKKGQVYVNTWHGTPMKTLGKDIKAPFLDHANVSRNFLQATHIISPNRHTTETLLDKYDIRHTYTGKISETGYPRIDLSLNLASTRSQIIAEKLGIKKNKPVVFYAPTWRGTSQNKIFDTDKLKNDLDFLKSDQYQLVFRGHHLAEKLLSEIKLDVIIAPKEIDSNELLALSDLLITDYSSIVYDFLSLNKPIISYIYDFSEYNKERGLYFTRDEMIGDICDEISEVKKSILENIKSQNSNISKSTVQKYSAFDDGSASKRAVDFVFHGDMSSCYEYEKKKVNIYFEGPFIPNGISRSFMNLMSSIETSQQHSVLVVNSADISQDAKRITEFELLPDSISVLARVGSTPMTLEELWVSQKFNATHQFMSKSFQTTLLQLYKREARRLFGDSFFENAIHFEGYALFWVMLFSQITAKQHIIYQHNDKYREWKSRFPYLKGVFNSYKLYDRIISVSEKTMENNILNIASEFNIPRKKFGFCNNTINIRQIIDSSIEKFPMEQEFTEYDGTKFINIGRMSHEKDQIKLVKAFSVINTLNNNTRLFILGDGPLREDIKKCISELKMEKSIFLLGMKPNPFPYLKNSDAFVLSSNHEGQPMVLLEALTLKVPIIATDIVGNRSILGDDYGLVVENSIQGLVDGMQELLDNPVQVTNFDPYAYQEDAVSQLLNMLENQHYTSKS